MHGILSIFATLFLLIQDGNGSNILLYPYARGFTSRLVDMKNIATELLERGNTVTVLINSEDKVFMERVRGLKYYEYPAPEGVIRTTDVEFMKLAFRSPEQQSSSLFDIINVLVNQEVAYCENLLQKKDILQKMKDEHFDLFIVDIMIQCGRILTHFLDIPTIAYHTMGMTSGYEFFPNIPSFVGITSLGFSGNMNFKDRFLNTLMHILINIMVSPTWYGTFDDLKAMHGLNKSLYISSAYVNKLVLTICDHSLDYPRPVLPNVICVGGMHNEHAKPLDDKFTTIVNSAQYGVILVSFGTLLPEMAGAKVQAIHGALKNLKETVIWKYNGDLHEKVNGNIHIVDWMPQNDLLGHPKVKLFVTHSGSHSTYETAFHGVPVVSIPIFVDQYDMAVKLTERAKMGVKVDFGTITSRALESAITEVLTNSTYRQNAKRTSKLFKDHPISAKERFYFYVDYIIRNNGASHLQMEAVQNLNTAQLYIVDVIVVLFLIGMTAIVAVVSFIWFICKCLCRYFKITSKLKQS